jgi:Protein of unknown function (DUF2490)
VAGGDAGRQIRSAKWAGNGFLLLVTVALLPCFAAPEESAQKSTTQQFWPELEVYVNLNEDSRFVLEYSATREHDLGSYENGLAGIYYDYYALPILRRELREMPDAARDKYLVFRIGYNYSQAPSYDKPNTQNILVLEVDPRAPLPWSVLLTDRNRLEFRTVNSNYEPRYRNRLRLERTFKVARFGLTPYADAEVFLQSKYQPNERAFDERRYTAGMEWTIIRSLVLQGYYTRQRQTQPTIQYVNAVGATLQIHLRHQQK